MRRLLLLMVLLSGTAAAAGYYDVRINSYDPVSGLYYKSIEDKIERTGLLSSKASMNVVVNINIFDPATNQSHVLFSEPQKEGIAIILFETGFKDGAIEFNGSTYHGVALNNKDIPQRAPRDKLLVGVRSDKSIELFVANKRGENMKRLASIPTSADWHIDVKNSKLRIVHPMANSVSIESLDW